MKSFNYRLKRGIIYTFCVGLAYNNHSEVYAMQETQGIDFNEHTHSTVHKNKITSAYDTKGSQIIPLKKNFFSAPQLRYSVIFIPFKEQPYVEGSNYKKNKNFKEENNYFDKKDKNFWVLKDEYSFKKATSELIDDEGNWKGNYPCPEIIKYSETLQESDLPFLEKWLIVKNLKYFAIADKNKSADFDLIYPWQAHILNNKENILNKHIEKLIWLDLEATLYEMSRGEMADISQQWLENHRDYHQENNHIFY